jgi:DNA-directed RNA polymerase subunit RPC12/RpoP
MQTVNFQCGHCGKLMAVGSGFLGQQVRCPYCQQVVVAPPPPSTNPIPAPVQAPPPAESNPAPAPLPEPLPAPELSETLVHVPTPTGDHEDIFSTSEATDDLFGRPEPPRLEIPPDPLAQTQAEAPVPAPQGETLTATAPYLPPEVAAPPSPTSDGTAILSSGDGESPWAAGSITEMLPFSPAEVPVESPPQSFTDTVSPSTSRPKRRAESGTPWFMILVFSPLVLYSIVVTVFAVLLYMHQREVEDRFIEDRFKILPDDGDNPGVQKEKGKKVSKVFSYKPDFATLPLPANLITTIGEPIQIGDVQVTPKRVERKRVSVFVQNHERPEPCTGDSLVLYLAIKNLSSEYSFAPLDNYFDRYWKPGTDQLPPLTQLEVGDKERFYGGPAKWYPRTDKGPEREWVEGRKGFEPELVKPGQEKEFFVCTDGEDARAALTLFGVRKNEKAREPYHGSLLWRVRVRRGLIQVRGKEYPATAVVGVKFTDKDVKEIH